MGVMLTVGFVAGAIGGALIKYLLSRILPEKPTVTLIIGVVVGAVVFTAIAIWAAWMQDVISNETVELTPDQLKPAGAYVKIDSMQPSPRDTILRSGEEIVVVAQHAQLLGFRNSS